MPPTLVRPATRALGLAAGLLGLVGLVTLVFGVLQLAAVNPDRPIVGVGTALLLFAYGALVLAVARGVFRGRRWSRGPAVAMSLLQVPVAWSFAGGETWWVALSLSAVSLAVLVCLLLKSSTVVFVPESKSSD